MIRRIIEWMFGPEGESIEEAEQRRMAERTRAAARQRFAPGLEARMRWEAQTQEAQGREHGD